MKNIKETSTKESKLNKNTNLLNSKRVSGQYVIKPYSILEDNKSEHSSIEQDLSFEVEEDKREKKISRVPNKEFDMEYSTMYRKEYEYLIEHGFQCSYIKKTKAYHVPIYKFTKTASLFQAVSSFYAQIENEKSFEEIDRKLKESGKNVTKEEGDRILRTFGFNVVNLDESK